MPGQGEDRAASILVELPGACLHKPKYTLLVRLWGAEFQAEGEKVPGPVVGSPGSGAAAVMSHSGVLERGKEM